MKKNSTFFGSRTTFWRGQTVTACVADPGDTEPHTTFWRGQTVTACVADPGDTESESGVGHAGALAGFVQYGAFQNVV